MLLRQVNCFKQISRLVCTVDSLIAGGQGYSQLSLRRTPLGPALAVRLREMSVL